MTATAEAILEQLKKLPASDLRELCRLVNQLISTTPPVSPQQATRSSDKEAGVDDEANEISFFRALDELRQRGTLSLETASLED